VGASPLFIWSFFGGQFLKDMALDADQVRSMAQRVAASHGLDVVELEMLGGAKHRVLRVFIEKNAEQRRKLAETDAGLKSESARVSVGVEQLSGVTHEDCEAFSRDFGTVLDVEDSIPGGEYTLEVSSPGLDRKLHGIEDYRRFAGMLVKVQTFEPVEGNRHWQGRLTEVSETAVKVEPQKKKGTGHRAQRSGKADEHAVEIALKNIEKAQLVPEF
jgi:ribosome maturation factor RimP